MLHKIHEGFGLYCWQMENVIKEIIFFTASFPLWLRSWYLPTLHPQLRGSGNVKRVMAVFEKTPTCCVPERLNPDCCKTRAVKSKRRHTTLFMYHLSSILLCSSWKLSKTYKFHTNSSCFLYLINSIAWANKKCLWNCCIFSAG